MERYSGFIPRRKSSSPQTSKTQGVVTAEPASTQLQLFCNALEKQQKKSLKLGKDAKKALDGFMRLNLDLLRFMKYQEINRTAMSKL